MDISAAANGHVECVEELKRSGAKFLLNENDNSPLRKSKFKLLFKCVLDSCLIV